MKVFSPSDIEAGGSLCVPGQCSLPIVLEQAGLHSETGRLPCSPFSQPLFHSNPPVLEENRTLRHMSRWTIQIQTKKPRGKEILIQWSQECTFGASIPAWNRGQATKQGKAAWAMLSSVKEELGPPPPLLHFHNRTPAAGTGSGEA